MFYLKATLLTATVILVLVNFSSCVEKKSTKAKALVKHTSQDKTPKKAIKNAAVTKDKAKPLDDHKSKHTTPKKIDKKASLKEAKLLAKHTLKQGTPKKTVKNAVKVKVKSLVKQKPKHSYETPKKTIKNVKDKAKTKKMNKIPREFHLFSDGGGGSGSGSGDGNKCDKPLDLVFALDSSESIREANWTKLVRFTKAVVKSLDLSRTRIAVIRYNTNAEVSIPLGFFQSAEAFSTTLDGVFYEPGGTRTDVALSKALAVFVSGGQRRASKVLVVVTDNPTNDIRISKENLIVGRDLVEKSSENLKSYEVITFAVGIKYSLTEQEKTDLNQEFMMITQDEDGDKRIVEVEDFDALLAASNKLAGKICLVNGGWSSWTPWSGCTESCGGGTKVRLRTCDNPKPMNNGTNCTALGGSSVETSACNIYPCTEGIEMTSLHLQTRPSVQNILFSKDCPNGFDFVNIDSNQMSASSVYTRNTGDGTIMKFHAPGNGKLYNVMNAGAWCAEHSQSVSNCQDQYIQIDLKIPVNIAKLGTQGQASLMSNNWVTFYKLNYSRDGRTWKQYRTLLTANSDRESLKENLISPPVKARYIRFNPIHWNIQGGNSVHDICMRVGVFKCTVVKNKTPHQKNLKRAVILPRKYRLP